MSKTVLVVDNHPLMLKFMSNLLEKEGYRVITAEDGLTAIEVLRQHTPHVIFIDLVMPNISGDKLCRVIRTMPDLDRTHIVILSAIAAEEEVDFRHFGATACIAKGPINRMAEHVLAVLEKLERGATDDLAEHTIGLEDIYSREISKELLSSKRHFEAILGNLSEGILELTQDGEIIYANKAAVSLTGIPEERLLAAAFLELFHEAHRGRVKELLEGIDQGPQLITEDAPVLLRGRYFTLGILQVSDDESTAIIAILSDVSERRRMEAQLRRARKMEAILAGSVAHDLNNILGGIVSYPELLLMKIPQDSPLCQPILTIQRAGQKAAAVVQDLLALARRGHATTEAVSLNDIISEYLESPEHRSLLAGRPGVRVITELDPDLLNVTGSSVHLSKVLMNLVFNAAEAIDGEGDVTVRTENRYVESPIRGFDEIPEGEYAAVIIADTGVGMSPEDIERIFEPFYTKKALGRSGTGLGMAVVWGTVVDHRGFIDVDSRRGEGSTFTLYFPVTRADIPERPAALAAADLAGRGEEILVVDDVLEQREIASTLLAELGYTVSTASSGEEAVDMLRRRSVDLVILDMIMEPGIDGLDTYRRMLEIRPDQRAIIVSGFSETDRVRAAQRLGAGPYVRKPYVLEEIGLAVRKELDRE